MFRESLEVSVPKVMLQVETWTKHFSKLGCFLLTVARPMDFQFYRAQRLGKLQASSLGLNTVKASHHEMRMALSKSLAVSDHRVCLEMNLLF